MTGLPPERSLEGQVLRLGTGQERGPIWLEQPRGKKPQVGVIHQGWKLVRHLSEDRDELFDCASDPLDLRDLSKNPPDLIPGLRALLSQHPRLVGPVEPAQEATLDSQDLELLKSLGYI